MSVVIQYDQRGAVTRFLPSADTQRFEGQPNTLINPDLSATVSPSPKDWRVVGGLVREATDQEKAARDSLRQQELRDAADNDQLNETAAVIALWKVLKANNPTLAQQWRTAYLAEIGA